MGLWDAGQPAEVARRKAKFDAELISEGARIAKKYKLNITEEKEAGSNMKAMDEAGSDMNESEVM